MSYIKTALYAFGLATLLNGSLISSSYAASGDRYFIVTTEELKKEFTSPDFNEYMNVGAVDNGGNDLYHAGKK